MRVNRRNTKSRLQLRRETVRTLSRHDLTVVVAGGGTRYCGTSWVDGQ